MKLLSKEFKIKNRAVEYKNDNMKYDLNGIAEVC